MSVILLRETAPLDAEICALPLLPPLPVRPHRAYLSAMPHLKYKSMAASTSLFFLPSTLSQLSTAQLLACRPLGRAPSTPRHALISAALESDANVCITPPICLARFEPLLICSFPLVRLVILYL